MMKKSLVLAAAAVGLMAMSATAHAFDTNACMGCHAIDIVKVGPSFKTVVAKYGDEKTLAKAFESGFAVKDRRIASSDATWKAKAAVMTAQFNIKIKGHEKEAAHALFETVKNNAYGNY
jgi:cytochrome c551/c552